MKPILLIRPEGNERDQQALTELGLDSIIDPYQTISANPDQAPAHQLLQEIERSVPNRHFAVTSLHALEKLESIVGADSLHFALQRNPQLQLWAVGPATRERLEGVSGLKVKVPPTANARSLALELKSYPAGTLLLPIGNFSLDVLTNELTPAGWAVISKIVYFNVQVAQAPDSVALVERGEVSAVLLRSPSAARAFLHFIPHPEIPLICGGSTTAQAVEHAGFPVAATAVNPDPEAVARVLFQTLNAGE